MSEHTNEQLVAALIDVVNADYRHYHETPGYQPADYARIAVRRWRSFARRGIRSRDTKARIMDLAKGLEQLLFRTNRNPFRGQFTALAERMVEVLLRYESPIDDTTTAP